MNPFLNFEAFEDEQVRTVVPIHLITIIHRRARTEEEHTRDFSVFPKGLKVHIAREKCRKNTSPLRTFYESFAHRRILKTPKTRNLQGQETYFHLLVR